LMDRYGVQINKTSRNSVLFMTNIGTNRSSVAYLVEVLVKLAQELDDRIADMSLTDRAHHERAVLRLTSPSAPLPDLASAQVRPSLAAFSVNSSCFWSKPRPEGPVLLRPLRFYW